VPFSARCVRHARWRLGREACLCTFTPSTSSSFCCSSCFSTRSCTRATELLALDLCAAVPSKEQAQACPQCAHKRASTASKCGDLHGCGTHAQSQEADMCGQTPIAVCADLHALSAWSVPWHLVLCTCVATCWLPTVLSSPAGMHASRPHGTA